MYKLFDENLDTYARQTFYQMLKMNYNYIRGLHRDYGAI